VPVSDCELTELLGVPEVRRRAWPYASSHPIEELRAPGSTLGRLLFKDLSQARGSIRPAFTADPIGEIVAYRDVLAESDVDAPRYIASRVDPGRAWLVVELVTGRPLWQVGDLPVWERAAGWLARLHALPLPDCAGLLRYDAEHLRRRIELAVWLPRRRQIAERAAERLGELPLSFIHGEFTASNVMVSGRRARIRPVDWETAGIGPGVLDLAALGLGSWSADERGRIEEAYRAACPPDRRPTEEQLDLARLVLAAQWTGWADGWVAPEQHRRDWRGQVSALVERLEL
jgi:aminoglycoside phosphotransferase (APT) family kinase protein